jgi:hypothetical protein
MSDEVPSIENSMAKRNVDCQSNDRPLEDMNCKSQPSWSIHKSEEDPTGVTLTRPNLAADSLLPDSVL